TWTRRLDSNYGSRIDCFAWGSFVETAESTPVNPKDAYAANFNGTSCAAAIIAGAALSVQGMAQNDPNRRKRLAPDNLRLLLSDPELNTPSANPPADKIRV